MVTVVAKVGFQSYVVTPPPSAHATSLKMMVVRVMATVIRMRMLVVVMMEEVVAV